MRWLPLSMILALLAACGVPPTEAERLDEVRGAFVYGQYHAASRLAVPLALRGYSSGNALLAQAQQRPGAQPMSPQQQAEVECMGRVLLAYGAVAANKNTVALAEADLAHERGCDPLLTGIATSLRGVTYSRLDMPQLAVAESQRGAQQLAGIVAPGEQDALGKMLMLHVVLAYSHMHDGRPELAGVHVESLGLLLNTPWLNELFDIGLTGREQGAQPALVRLKRLGDNPDVPPGVRALLAQSVAAVEADYGSVESPMFMPRLFAGVLWELLAERGPDAMRELLQVLRAGAVGIDEAAGWWDRIVGWGLGLLK